jgi:hypothetical protein
VCAPAGFASYNWSIPGGGSASGQCITANTPGIYTVVCNPIIACSAPQTVTVSVGGGFTANITTTNVSCYGGSNGSASVSITGGTAPFNYTWSPTGGNAAIASGLTAGIYTATIMDSNNCVKTATVNITQPAPINTSVSVNGGTLTALQTGATYQWYDCNNNTNIPGATNQSYVVPGNGSYAVIIIVGACSDTSTCQVITAIQSITSTNSIHLFPNSTNGYLNIKGLERDSKIELYDAIGKLVMFVTTANNEEKISVAELDEGVYLIRIISKEDVYQSKVIIKK